MSYSCLRHQHYSPKDPCGACTRERYMQMMGSSNQQAAMARMQAQSRWPQDVFERLEKERDAAVAIAAEMARLLRRVVQNESSAFADECEEVLRKAGVLGGTDT